MFLYKKKKKISQKEAAVIGFVLAVMSLLTSALLGYLTPAVDIWLRLHGVNNLGVLLLLFAGTLFLSIQGLLLFGFPLFYANDKKSHMTGFQILVYALLWILLLMILIVVLSAALSSGPAALPIS